MDNTINFVFSTFVKVLFILIYIIGLVGGLIPYRIKNKGIIVNRIDVEEKGVKNKKRKNNLEDGNNHSPRHARGFAFVSANAVLVKKKG